jgi:hypothetical protein
VQQARADGRRRHSRAIQKEQQGDGGLDHPVHDHGRLSAGGKQRRQDHHADQGQQIAVDRQAGQETSAWIGSGCGGLTHR